MNLSFLSFQDLSLFLVKYSVLNLFLLLCCCSLHSYKQREKKVLSDPIVAFLCLLICSDPEWETAYKHATKTGLIQNISLGREKAYIFGHNLLGEIHSAIILMLMDLNPSFRCSTEVNALFVFCNH